MIGGCSLRQYGVITTDRSTPKVPQETSKDFYETSPDSSPIPTKPRVEDTTEDSIESKDIKAPLLTHEAPPVEESNSERSRPESWLSSIISSNFSEPEEKIFNSVQFLRQYKKLTQSNFNVLEEHPPLPKKLKFFITMARRDALRCLSTLGKKKVPYNSLTNEVLEDVRKECTKKVSGGLPWVKFGHTGNIRSRAVHIHTLWITEEDPEKKSRLRKLLQLLGSVFLSTYFINQRYDGIFGYEKPKFKKWKKFGFFVKGGNVITSIPSVCQHIHENISLLSTASISTLLNAIEAIEKDVSNGNYFLSDSDWNWIVKTKQQLNNKRFP